MNSAASSGLSTRCRASSKVSALPDVRTNRSQGTGSLRAFTLTRSSRSISGNPSPACRLRRWHQLAKVVLPASRRGYRPVDEVFLLLTGNFFHHPIELGALIAAVAVERDPAFVLGWKPDFEPGSGQPEPDKRPMIDEHEALSRRAITMSRQLCHVLSLRPAACPGIPSSPVDPAYGHGRGWSAPVSPSTPLTSATVACGIADATLSG